MTFVQVLGLSVVLLVFLIAVPSVFEQLGRLHFKRRRGIGRERVIGKLLTAIIFSFLLLYVVPVLIHAPGEFSFVNGVLLLLAVGLVIDATALFLAGKRSWKILLPALVLMVFVTILIGVGY